MGTGDFNGGSTDELARIGGRQGGTVYLMYHEIAVAGRRLSRDFSGHVAYAVPEAELRSQLHSLRERRWRGISVTEALSINAGNSHLDVVLTFDDGSETDLLTAAPLLKEMDFKATFYVIVGWLGRRGYLSQSQLKELQGQGFEVGCHSMNHRYLTRLSEIELRIETAEAKARLEQILGVRVDHFSCPGGFWDARVARAAELAGYHSVATSRAGVNTRNTDPYCLARISIMKGTPRADFDRVCRGKGLFARRAREAILSVPKSLLGAEFYVKLHSVLHRD
jgi:peptidoglycan/xylan/chitin deacetylase (PgdA/CDA1 family)